MSLKNFPYIVPLVVATALFMDFLDGTILTTALPTIATAFGTSAAHLSLAITSYLIAAAVFLPLCGWISDRFGVRTVFQTAIVIFTLSSMACGFSTNLAELVFWRVIQGIGGALMVPVGRLAILRATPKKMLVDALMWFSIPALVAPLIGPFVGGLIVTYWSWKWIFFVNVPMGLLGIILASIFIENTKEEKPAPVDLIGFLLLGTALGGLVFGLELLVHPIVPIFYPVAILATSITCAVLYPRHARKIEHPIINTNLLIIPTFFTGTVGGLPFRIGAGSMPFLLPLILQIALGYSPVSAGAMTASVGLSSICAKFFISPLLSKYGFRRILSLATLLCICNLASYSLFSHFPSSIVIFSILFIGGIIRSVEYTSLNVISYSDITEKHLSSASTIASMSMEVGQSLGVCFGAIVLNLTLMAYGTNTINSETLLPAILICASLPLGTLYFIHRLATHAGSSISGHGGEASI